MFRLILLLVASALVCRGDATRAADVAVAASSVAPFAAPEPPERRTKVVEEVSIQYSVGDEIYVEELERQLKDFQFEPLAAHSRAEDLITSRRSENLAAMAGMLGLDEPTPQMEKTYSGFEDLLANSATFAFDQNLRRPTSFGLWRRTELVQRLQAGEVVPGLTLKGSQGLSFTLSLTSEKKIVDPKAFWAAHTFPIFLGKSSPEEDIRTGLVHGKSAVDGFARVRENFGPFVVLHETAEVGIVTRYIRSTDRRWFCDGVANYIALRVLEQAVGPEEARKYYDLEVELKKFAREASSVDLVNWPNLSGKEKTDFNKRLDTASYAFATKAIADICRRHGDDILPRLFAELGKTDIEQASMRHVYTAFTDLTGEDMKDYLKFGRRSPELKFP